MSQFLSQLPLQASTLQSLVSVTPVESPCVSIVKPVVSVGFDTSITCISHSLHCVSTRVRISPVRSSMMSSFRARTSTVLVGESRRT